MHRRRRRRKRAIDPGRGWEGGVALLVAISAVGCSGAGTETPGGGGGLDGATAGVDGHDTLGGGGAVEVPDTSSSVDSLVMSDGDPGDGRGGGDGSSDAAGSRAPCSSDKDCIGLDQVCAKAAGSCVDCLASSDCPQGLTCKAHTCLAPPSPCKSSKECSATDQICDKSAAICVDCLGDDDCVAAELCIEQVCVAPLCAPGSTSCVDPATLATCDARGGAVKALACPGGTSCKGGACVANSGQVCQPGTAICEGQATRSCKADGGGYGPAVPCAATETCAAGACTSAACATGASKCAGSTTALSCDSATGSWVEKACALGQFCIAAGSAFGCSEAECAPGTLVCKGDLVAECSASGVANDVTEDCGKKGLVCKSGVCAAKDMPPQVCAPGSAICGDGALQTCKADGSGYDVTACGDGAVCKAGACVKTVCTPAATQCAGSKLEACSPDGTEWSEVTDCAAAGEVCKAGACASAGCTPGTKGCSDAVTAWSCSGAGALISAPCLAKHACDAGVCVQTLCTPGSADCNDGATEKVCAADGKSWAKVAACPPPAACQSVTCVAGKGCVAAALGDGGACGEGKVCSAGACVEAKGCLACAPGQTCVDGACKDCTALKIPKFVGPIVTYATPVATNGLIALAWSPKHGEFWQSHGPSNLPATVVRYDGQWKAKGLTFATPLPPRQMAPLADGGMVASYFGSEPPFIRRTKEFSPDTVWAVSPTPLKWAPTGLTSYQGGALVAGAGWQTDATQFVMLDVATGATLWSKSVSSSSSATPLGMFVIGDVLWAIGQQMRWLVQPIMGIIDYVPTEELPWKLGGSMLTYIGAFDGKRMCLLAPQIPNHLFCYEMFEGCSSSPKTDLPFAASRILLPSEQQTVLAAMPKAQGTWTRCAAASGNIFNIFHSKCGTGPTLLVWGWADGTVASRKVAAIYSATGWPTAAGSALDTATFALNVITGAKAVPADGQAKLVTSTNAGPEIVGLFKCTFSNELCEFTMGSFACSDGSDATSCKAKIFGGIANSQRAFEAWRLQP